MSETISFFSIGEFSLFIIIMATFGLVSNFLLLIILFYLIFFNFLVFFRIKIFIFLLYFLLLCVHPLSYGHTVELPMRPTHVLVDQEALPIYNLGWQSALVLM